MGSKFEAGKTYEVHAGSAHFNCKVAKRTKCTVTFEIPEEFECWLTGKIYPQGGMTVTLRKGGNYTTEHVSGSPKVWRNVKLEAWA